MEKGLRALTFGLILMLLPCAVSAFSFVTIYDTGFESIGDTGLYGGSLVSDRQFLGVKFQSNGNYVGLRIGGHFGGTPDATLFGAVFEIADANSLPNLHDLENDPGLVGSSVFAVPQASAVVFGDLSAQIRNNRWYALVFGSGLFGAAGSGFTPYENVTLNTFANSFWYNMTVGPPFLGEVQSTLGYFALEGRRGVPEPGSFALLAAGILCLIWFRRASSSGS